MRHIRHLSESGLAVLLGAAVLVGPSAATGAASPSEDPDRSVLSLAPAPGTCLEAESSVLGSVSWREIHQALVTAVAQEPDFFSDAAIVSEPDLTQPLVPADTPTVKVGIWAAAEDDPGSNEARRGRLAVTDCLAEDASWTVTISYELLVAGAERILANARLPDESGTPPIREDAEAAIFVEFHPAEQRVRTILEFNVPVGPFRPGGTCWIDDVLGVDPGTGRAVTSANAGMDVDWIVESGCDKFQDFMIEGGAGEQALTLLPAEVPLSDGTSARFVVASVDVDADTIVLSGAIDHG